MIQMNTGKRPMRKMLFGILVVIVLALLGAGAYLSTRPAVAASSEIMLLPVTGSNVTSHRVFMILRQQVSQPVENTFELGGGYTLVVNQDGSAYMLTPFMAANTGD